MLDEKSLDNWHRLTSFANHTKDVVKNLRQHIDPEMCTGAWAKMYEILDGFQLFGDPTHQDAGREFTTLHVCEVRSPASRTWCTSFLYTIHIALNALFAYIFHLFLPAHPYIFFSRHRVRSLRRRIIIYKVILAALLLVQNGTGWALPLTPIMRITVGVLSFFLFFFSFHFFLYLFYCYLLLKNTKGNQSRFQCIVSCV